MSKKKKKPALTPWSLGSLPTTPVAVKNPDYETDAQLKARLIREEAEARRNADPLYQHEQAMSKTYRELRALSSAFWSRSGDEIAKELNSEGATDITFAAPLTEKQYTFEDLQSAFTTWFENTLLPSGWELSEVGGHRLIRFGLANAKSQGIDFSRPDVWNLAFLHLKDVLKAFQPGDFIKEPRVPQVPQKAPRPDLESLALEHDEDRKVARQIVAEDLYSSAAPLHQAWLESLYRNFGGFVPSPDDLKYVYNTWFPRSNKSYLRHDSYDAARRHMVTSGRWPETLLTEDERVAREIESGPALATLGFDERWRMMSKVQRQRRDQAS